MSTPRRWIESVTLPEVPLPNGDVTEIVVRVGDTVRRTQSANAPYVHAVLDHLEAVGFDGAPRYLGEDDLGREVLTYVEGEVSGRPRPEWIADELRLTSVARLLRRYDDAVSSFVAPPGVTAYTGPGEQSSLPPAPVAPPELAAHLDVTQENVVFVAGEAVALIDFDLVQPATRVDEVYNALIWWGQLTDPQDRDRWMRTVDVPRRCRLFADAYGMSEADRSQLTEVALMRSRRSWHLMKQRAEVSGGGWQRMWEAGVGDSILRRQRWLDRNATAIDAALLA